MHEIKTHIPYVNLKKQWEEDRKELLPIIDNVLSTGQYIGGDEVDVFEKNIANLCGVKYAVSLNSGTDALTLALYLCGVGKGDEVITPPNSFIASTAVIVHTGAKPVFVDVQDDQNIDPEKIEKAITKNTKAIMPVHLTGRMCNMDPIIDLANKYDLIIIEDAAQAIGSKYRDLNSGSIGHVGCFSTHPLKNLNACGDGGFLTTNDENIYLKVKSLSSHGIENRDTVSNFGYVSRMDNLQASILNFRLKNLNTVTDFRRKNAFKYINEIRSKNIQLPIEKEYEFNTYHTFVIQLKNRDKLKEYLLNNGVETAIHYPTPIHLQPAAKSLGYVLGDFPKAESQSGKILTLPVNQYLSKDEITRIINLINKF